MRRRQNQSGMVTVEVAMASLLIAVALLVASWAGNLGLLWLQCSDAAAAVARQEARGDGVGVAVAKESAPRSASIQVRRDGLMVEVVVSLTTPAWGRILPSVPISGAARVIAET